MATYIPLVDADNKEFVTADSVPVLVINEELIVQLLDETGSRQFVTKTKEYIDSLTTYQITEVTESTDSINFTIVAETGVTPEPTDELLGTWVFNEDLNNSEGILAQLYFSSDGKIFNSLNLYTTYDSMSPVRPGEEPDYQLYLVYFSTEIVEQYALAGFKPVYWTDSSNPAYRTITITDTSTLTNRDEFTTWLKANATKQ